MSAADLFKDAYDAEFRLKGTWIMIGRLPFFVRNCIPDGSTRAEDAILILQDLKDDEVNVKLGRLPLRTMFDCPSGYYEGFYMTRGPARQRYQGITGSSLWGVNPNGSVEAGGVSNVKKVLRELSIQPRTRRPGKRPSGALTRDVYIGREQVLVRGRLRGLYKGENKVELLDSSPLTKRLIENAKLEVV